MVTTTPGLEWERRAWQAGREVVAGVDEAGRGAWAGPLVAAAVAVPRDARQRARLTRAFNQAHTAARDSKLLSAGQRARVRAVLDALEVPHAVAEVPPGEIDALGLGPANRAAMVRAVAALDPAPDHVLVDAFRLPELGCPHDAIVHGDARCLSIALASIVAKLHRDALMAALAEAHPEYAFHAHKGYGTAAHLAAIERHGICAQHRRSFAPIARFQATDADAR